MDKPPKRPESVLVVVHTRARDILLLRRKDPPVFWQSVTGSLHWQETEPREAAIRELKEETGLSVRSGELFDWGRTSRFEILPEYRHRYADGVTHNTEHLFSFCLPESVPITLNDAEHTAYRWADVEQARQLLWSWSNRDALDFLFPAPDGKPSESRSQPVPRC